MNKKILLLLIKYDNKDNQKKIESTIWKIWKNRKIEKNFSFKNIIEFILYLLSIYFLIKYNNFNYFLEFLSFQFFINYLIIDIYLIKLY